MPLLLRQLAMTPDSLAAVVAFTTVAVLVAATLAQRHQYNKKYKLPVKIPGIPVFGNSFQVGVWMVGWALYDPEHGRMR